MQCCDRLKKWTLLLLESEMDIFFPKQKFLFVNSINFVIHKIFIVFSRKKNFGKSWQIFINLKKLWENTLFYVYRSIYFENWIVFLCIEIFELYTHFSSISFALSRTSRALCSSSKYNFFVLSTSCTHVCSSFCTIINWSMACNKFPFSILIFLIFI